MGDVISSHLDEAKREIITARTGKAMAEFGRLYEQQYAVALFNKVRFDIEGGGGPQPQLLHRKVPLENKSIFSGSLFQYLEENKKWRSHFFFIPHCYNINYYDNKASHDRRLHPKGTINCAGYKVLTAMEQYLDLISNSLPGVKAKVSSSPFLKCATQFPLILWHPYARHYYFCATTEKEQQKWHAVLQDCVRHANDGLSEEDKVQTPAFTDALRLYRQAQGHYGTWEMMCGEPSQILSNLVMEGLLPELRDLISPRLKGKMHERQRNWMLISDAIYSLVQGQCQSQHEAAVKRCDEGRPSLEASIRTDMDQIITSKEHVTNKIRVVVLPKAEKLLKVSIEPYISSILEALMEPTSRGFSEVRDVFFKELVDMSKNTINEGSKETVAQHMEKISMLAFHPVKMQSCYEKVEQLSLEGLQQRFDVSSPSVFVQRAQILMREQMDDAVYTFEQILHQSLESQGSEELCKTIQRCQDRVIKKFDYDSSTVRKRFFREALLQIFIPYMLKQLGPSCASELPRFQELIFEDFSRFILVENIFEEVVLHSVTKDIMMAVKEAAVQRKHNLYRDSIVLGHSDPSLHLLGLKPSIDWAEEYGAQEEDGAGEDDDESEASQKRKRMKQVVSMVQEEGGVVLPNESCVEGIPEEGEKNGAEDSEAPSSTDGQQKKECVIPEPSEQPPALSNGLVSEEAETKPAVQEKDATSAAAVEKAKTTEDSLPVTEDASKEPHPPLPSPEKTPSGATATERGPEAAPEGPPVETAHNSNVQSPSSEEAETKEGVAAAACTDAPQCEKEVVTKEGVAAAPCTDSPQRAETQAKEEEPKEAVAAAPCTDAPQRAETQVKEEEPKEAVAAAPCTDAPQRAETQVKEAAPKEAVAAAPCTDAPQRAETQAKEEEPKEAVAAAPCTDAPQRAETQVKEEEPKEAVAAAPCTDAPQCEKEVVTKEGVAAAPCTDAPQRAETQVKEAAPKEGVAAAPCTDAPQRAETQAKEAEPKEAVAGAPCTDAPHHVKEVEPKEGVAAAPCTDAPQCAETQAKEEEPKEAVAPAPCTDAPHHVKEVEPKEGVAAAPCTNGPQSAETQAKEAEPKEAVAAAPCTDAPQCAETQVKEAEPKEGVAAAPCTDAPQSAETHVKEEETKEGVAPAPSTDAPQCADTPSKEAELTSAAAESETKPSDSDSGLQ